MLGKRFLAIVEVNSATLKMTVLTRHDDSLCPSYTAEYQYAGIRDGRFVNPQEIMTVLIGFSDELYQKTGIRCKEFHILLPDVFTAITLHDAEIDIGGRVVTENDIERIFQRCDVFDNDYQSIGFSALQYKSFRSPVISEPVGEVCDKLFGRISSVCLDRRIKEIFDNVAKRMGAEYFYYSNGMAVAHKLTDGLALPKDYRAVVLMREEDTAVVLTYGKAILDVQTVEWGASHAAYALQDLFGIDYACADKLLSKMNLNIAFKSDDNYFVEIAGHTERFSIGKSNTRVVQYLEVWAKEVKKAVEVFRLEAPPAMYLTGSALCGVRGVKELLEDVLDCDIPALTVNQTELSGAADYPLSAIIDYIEKAKFKNNRPIHKLTEKLFRRK